MILLLAGMAWLAALAVGIAIRHVQCRVRHGDPRRPDGREIEFDFPHNKSARAETSRPSAASNPEWRADGTQE